MKKRHIKNVRAVHEYCHFLKEAKSLCEASVDGITKAINRFEEYTNYKDFNKFHCQQAVGFKKYLIGQKNVVTDKPLSKATLHTTIRHLKTFFQYLSMQGNYKFSIKYSDAEYFNLSNKDTRIATAKRNKPVPKIEQIVQVLEAMPSTTNIEMRDRALVAFTLLTGARDSAIASVKIKHISLEEQALNQDAREVNTKYSKTFTTYFFPVGDLPLQIFTEWFNYLTKELMFSPNDPLFPKTKVKNSSKHKFEAIGLLREHWSTAGAIRRVFKQGFKGADLPYFNPHSFRNTLVHLGMDICTDPKVFKAWSQNLGHQSVLTTFYSYGEVPDYLQSKLLKKLSEPTVEMNPEILAGLEMMIKKMVK